MAQIIYEIDNARVPIVLADFLYLIKNGETKPDPNWIDPNDGSEAPQIPRWTDAQWYQEWWRRQQVSFIKRSRQKQSNDQASAVGSTDGEVTNG